MKKIIYAVLFFLGMGFISAKQDVVLKDISACAGESFLADSGSESCGDEILCDVTEAKSCPPSKAPKKIKKSYSRLREEAAEEIETLLHESSDLISSLATMQKKYMKELRHVAENDPNMTRVELEELFSRAQTVSKQITGCIGNLK